MDLPQLLTIEDDLAILDFRCPSSGYLLWPLIRVQCLRFAMSDHLYEQPLIDTSPRRNGISAVRTLARAAAHNFVRGRQLRGSVMVMGTGLGLYRRDALWHNRLADPFAEMLPDASIEVEDFVDWRWPMPRHFKRTLFHAPTQAAASLIGRATGARHLDLAGRLVALIRQRGQRLLNWDLGEARATYLTQSLARHTAALPFRRQAYRRMLARAGVKLLLKEEGCYGPASVVLQVAREMNIVTAEYQHGTISAGNDAYNLAPSLANSPEYKKTLPEYLLGYGAWWNEQINVPVEKIVIGNPHREVQLAGLDAAVPARRDVLLILGDGIETERYLTLAHELSAAVSHLRVMFRPHPLERARVTRCFQDNRNGSVWLDGEPDIYRSLHRAHAVVSEVSTGLFEALGVASRVFMWDTEKARFCFPAHPFEVFHSARHLALQLSHPESPHGTFDLERIWASGWRERYLNFLQRIRLDEDVLKNALAEVAQ